MDNYLEPIDKKSSFINVLEKHLILAAASKVFSSCALQAYLPGTILYFTSYRNAMRLGAGYFHSTGV